MTATTEPTTPSAPRPTDPDEMVLQQIARRVLWLSAAIVDAANAGRPNDSGVKVGGHQASSASMVDIMVALWFAELTELDRVSVKPHASPVLHAINYLLGDLDESYLPTLRAKGGLQSYPSRLKDPDTVDFSTGSVASGRRPRCGQRWRTVTSPPSSPVRRRPDGSSASSATPSSTRGRSGRRWPTRQWLGWVSCCGWSI
jgi:pyruvate dehydrogenase complex dehydrogenase (E1) component